MVLGWCSRARESFIVPFGEVPKVLGETPGLAVVGGGDVDPVTREVSYRGGPVPRGDASATDPVLDIDAVPWPEGSGACPLVGAPLGLLRARGPPRDRAATVTHLSGDRVYITTASESKTWRLPKNLLHLSEADYKRLANT